MISRFNKPGTSLPAPGTAGFTLIEVLISMAIMAFISLGIYQATSETFRLRDSISVEGDFFNNIRLAMTLLNRDIMMMYSPTIMLPSPTPTTQQPVPGMPGPGGAAPAAAGAPNPAPNFAGLDSNTVAQLQMTSDFWGAAVDKSGIRPMHFIGREDRMSFISTSHVRIYKDSPESEIAQIAYELKPDDQSGSDKIADSKVLVKTENPDAFDMDPTRSKAFAHSYPLLPGITSLKFEYCTWDTVQWTCLHEWDSMLVTPVNTYPQLIKVHLEVKGRDRMYFNGIYEFRPEVPLGGIVPSF